MCNLARSGCGWRMLPVGLLARLQISESAGARAIPGRIDNGGLVPKKDGRRELAQTLGPTTAYLASSLHHFPAKLATVLLRRSSNMTRIGLGACDRGGQAA